MTSSSTEYDPFATQEFPKTPSVSFKGLPVGTKKGGKVVEIEDDVQGYAYNRNPDAPKVKATWPSGDPKLSIVITVDTAEGRQAFWITKYKKDSQFQAVKQAQDKIGRPLAKGDELWMKYTGDEGVDPVRKLYAAQIVPATPDAFAEDEPPF